MGQSTASFAIFDNRRLVNGLQYTLSTVYPTVIAGIGGEMSDQTYNVLAQYAPRSISLQAQGTQQPFHSCRNEPGWTSQAPSNPPDRAGQAKDLQEVAYPWHILDKCQGLSDNERGTPAMVTPFYWGKDTSKHARGHARRDAGHSWQRYIGQRWL